MSTLFSNATHTATTSGTIGAPTLGTKITKLAFSNRLSFAEETGIETAGVSDAEVRVILRKLNNAKFIDLALTQTASLLAILVSKTLLTSERATAILTGTVTADEVY